MLDILEKDPDAETPPYGTGKPSCLRLVLLRDWCLHDAGFADPWKAIKEDELHKALELLPEVRMGFCCNMRICIQTLSYYSFQTRLRACTIACKPAIRFSGGFVESDVQQGMSAGATRGGRDRR